MFAEYNFNLYPYVLVKFNENIENQEDFDLFITQWKHLYLKKINFTFIFDTTNVSLPPIKYCYQMAKFISELRSESKQYLQKSIIIVKNKNIMRLLNLIFLIQPPVAPVYITDDKLPKILELIESKKNIIENINILKFIEDKEPLLPFL